MQLLKVPYPISANRYWRRAGVRLIRSKEAMDYKRIVALSARMARIPLRSGPVSVSLIFHPKTTKSGAASKTRLDLDNTIKVTLDALNEIAYLDDSQIVELHAKIGDPLKNGGMTIYVGDAA